MPRQTMDILTEEEIAYNSFLDERNKMSNDFARIMNKQTRKEHFIEGALGGTILGLLFGFIAGQTVGRVPEHDANGRVIEYKYNGHKAMDAMWKTVAVSILLMLGVAGIKTLTDKKRNHNRADTLAQNVMNSYFKGPLMNYKGETETKFHNVRAAALVINNMPESELNRLRALALDSLECDELGHYSVHNHAIASAAQIISNFIAYNPELGYNVLRIMRGEEPTTYFLTSIQQKTR